MGNRICLVTAHKTGSRWLAKMLCQYYRLQSSPEFIGAYGIGVDLVERTHFRNNKLLKIHPLRNDVLDMIDTEWAPIKCLVLVRSPRDRLVSYALHWRYHTDDKQFPQKMVGSDIDAMKVSLDSSKDPLFNVEEDFQYYAMTHYPNIHSSMSRSSNIAWSTYKDLNYNTEKELTNIISFLSNGKVSKSRVSAVVLSNRFKKLSNGRDKGIEDKRNIRFRKGIVGDYLNYFDDSLYESTKEIDRRYNKALNSSDAFLKIGKTDIDSDE